MLKVARDISFNGLTYLYFSSLILFSRYMSVRSFGGPAGILTVKALGVFAVPSTAYDLHT